MQLPAVGCLLCSCYISLVLSGWGTTTPNNKPILNAQLHVCIPFIKIGQSFSSTCLVELHSLHTLDNFESVSPDFYLICPNTHSYSNNNISSSDLELTMEYHYICTQQEQVTKYISIVMIFILVQLYVPKIPSLSPERDYMVQIDGKRSYLHGID